MRTSISFSGGEWLAVCITFPYHVFVSWLMAIKWTLVVQREEYEMTS